MSAAAELGRRSSALTRVQQVVDVLRRRAARGRGPSRRTRCRSSRRASTQPRQREDRRARRRRGRSRRPPAGASSWARVMCVPRDGRMRGTSASSCSSLGPQPVGPHAGGVDDVVGAQLEALAAERVAHADAARAAALLEQLGDLAAGWRTPRRSARPRPARSARDGCRRSGSRRRGSPTSARGRPAPAGARRPRRRRSRDGARAPQSSRRRLAPAARARRRASTAITS